MNLMNLDANTKLYIVGGVIILLVIIVLWVVLSRKEKDCPICPTPICPTCPTCPSQPTCPTCKTYKPDEVLFRIPVFISRSSQSPTLLTTDCDDTRKIIIKDAI